MRRSTRALPPAAAAAAAAAPAPAPKRVAAGRAAKAKTKDADADTEMTDAPPPTKATTTRAKRGRTAAPEPDESTAAAAAAAPDQPKSKRLRAQAERAASPAVVEEEEEEEEEEKAPKKKERTEDELLLDTLTTPLVGHLFAITAANVNTDGDSSIGGSVRPALPLVSLLSVCDYLTVREAAVDLACTSRGAYASVVEYGRVLQNRLKKHSVEPPVQQTRLKSLRGVSNMCASRLCSLVTRLATPPLDAKLLGAVVSSMPNLRALTFTLHHEAVSVQFHYPPGLHELNLSLQFKVQKHLTPSERRARATPPAKSWTTERCHEYALMAMAGVTKLKHLRSFSLGMHPGGNGRPAPQWLEPLEKLPELHTLTIEHTTRMWGSSLVRQSAKQLRAISSLTQINDRSTQESIFWASTLVDLLDAKGKASQRLTSVNLERETCSDALRLALLPFAGSLTSLRPAVFTVADCSWLTEFPELKELSVAVSPFGALRNSYNHFGQAQQDLPPIEQVDPVSLAIAVAQLRKLTWLNLNVPLITCDQLEQIVRALTLLETLNVTSTEVNSLNWLAPTVAPHLAERLKSLAIHLPKVPRDDSSQLLSLSALAELDISGSFSEPLFAKQLFPFLPPYPTAALHMMRKFVPRSQKEPVPMPPVDLMAKAAAVADFDARVRAGEVRAAERMNSSQLSLVFQFLDVKEFSFTARTCRSWRNAASLPSSWGVANSPDVGRVLTLSSSLVQCDSTILPTLPLWKNARAVKFGLSYEHARRNYGWHHQLSNPHNANHPVLVRALDAVSLLTRVESLTTDIREGDADTAKANFFQKLAPRLCWADIAGVQPSELMQMERMRVLTVRSTGEFGLATAISHLHQLVELNVVSTGGGLIGPEFGDLLRGLSLQHALRTISLGVESHVNKDDPSVSNFFASLAANGTGGATGAAAAEVMSLDDGPSLSEPAALTSITATVRTNAAALPLRHILSLPQLRTLSIQATGYQWGGNKDDSGYCYDYAELEALAASDKLSPLESLDLCVHHRDVSMPNLGLLTGLKSLSITDTQIPSQRSYHYHSSPVSELSRLPVGCLDRWLRRMPLLESLALRIQLYSNEFASLARLPSFKTLRLTQLDERSLTLADLDVLPQCARFEHLALTSILHLHLIKLDWLTAIHAKLEPITLNDPTEEIDEAHEPAEAKDETLKDETSDAQPPKEDKNEKDQKDQTSSAMEVDDLVDTIAPARSSLAPVVSRPSAYPDLIHILAACPSLRSVAWVPHQDAFDDAVTYVEDTARMRPRRSSATTFARARREHARARHALRQLSQRRQEAIEAAAAARRASMDSNPDDTDVGSVGPLPLSVSYGNVGTDSIVLVISSSDPAVAKPIETDAREMEIEEQEESDATDAIRYKLEKVRKEKELRAARGKKKAAKKRY